MASTAASAGRNLSTATNLFSFFVSVQQFTHLNTYVSVYDWKHRFNIIINWLVLTHGTLRSIITLTLGCFDTHYKICKLCLNIIIAVEDYSN